MMVVTARGHGGGPDCLASFRAKILNFIGYLSWCRIRVPVAIPGPGISEVGGSGAISPSVVDGAAAGVASGVIPGAGVGTGGGP